MPNILADIYLILSKILTEIKFFEKFDILLNKSHQDIDPENTPIIIREISFKEKLLTIPLENTPMKLMIVMGFVNVNRNVVRTNEIIVLLSMVESSHFIIDFDLNSFTAKYSSNIPPNTLINNALFKRN